MSEDLPGAAAIPLTQWTLVDLAGQGRPEAIEEFLKLYRPAMVVHLIIRNRCQSGDAEDIVQSFIVDKVITRNILAVVDRTRGKRFRNFLLTVLDRYVLEQQRKDASLKRKPDVASQLDENCAVQAASPVVDEFEVQWARDLLAHCISRMQQDCAAMGQMRQFEIFRLRVLEPAFTGSEPACYQDLVDRFGFEDPMQVSNALVTAKRKFERHLRNCVKEYTHSESEVDEELTELFNVLARSV